MSTPTDPSQTRDAAYWAKPVDKLTTSNISAEALNLNVDGKSLTGPIRGFGQLWQKTFRVRLTGMAITPQAVIADWKQNFPSFWPKGSRPSVQRHDYLQCLRRRRCHDGAGSIAGAAL